MHKRPIRGISRSFRGSLRRMYLRSECAVKIYSDTRYFFRKQKRDVGRRAGYLLIELNYHRFLAAFRASSPLRGELSSSPVNENLRGREGRKRYTMGFCSLREANGRANGGEREREVEKSLVRAAKGRFGKLHCARNMKIELGRMDQVISLSRVSQGQKVRVSFTDFSIPRRSPPPLATPGKLTSRDISKRGTLLPSQNVIPRETCAPFAQNNGSSEVETLPFSRDGNYISPTPQSSPLFPPTP